jgi:hypothetical protein
MREFTDPEGRTWLATVRGGGGADYKGRVCLVMEPVGGAGEGALELHDVRWNSERTARRSLASMSDVELRRRLRMAVGRHGLRRAS